MQILMGLERHAGRTRQVKCLVATARHLLYRDTFALCPFPVFVYFFFFPFFFVAK